MPELDQTPVLVPVQARCQALELVQELLGSPVPVPVPVCMGPGSPVQEPELGLCLLPVPEQARCLELGQAPVLASHLLPAPELVSIGPASPVRVPELGLCLVREPELARCPVWAPGQELGWLNRRRVGHEHARRHHTDRV